MVALNAAANRLEGRHFEASREKRSKRSKGSKLSCPQVIEKMERETGVEPATSSLGKWIRFCFQ